MKKVVILILVTGLTFPMYGVAKDLKIGYVDILKIFNEYQKTKEYDKMLEEKKSAKEKELEQKKEEIREMQDKLELLKDKEQEKEREKITKAAGEYRELERQFILDLKKERDEKMKEIINDINRVIEDYGSQKGFDLIINKGAILYGRKGIDLTETILKIVNQKYKK